MGGLSEDKIMHLVAFGLMAIVLDRALRWELPHLARGRQLLIAALLASAVGALLELVQATLPHRSAEVLDWIADTLGAALAGLLVFKVKRAETEN
jgi:VanZ family protein